MASTLEQSLGTVLQRELPGFQSLQSCEQLTAGASQETYRLTLQTDDGSRHLALRRMQPNLSQASSVGTILPDTEARLFQLATAAGIPGPGVVYILQPSDALGNGFLMDWLQGETLGQRVVRSEALAGVRPRLARQCGEILGRIHNLDWHSAGLDDALPTVAPATLVDDTWANYRDLNVPVPMIDFAWRWLRDHLPEQPRTTLVHGDFRNGNLMVAPDGVNAVLDWELAHIGDPVRDLGWLCVNSWRFGQADLPVGGFGAVEDLCPLVEGEDLGAEKEAGIQEAVPLAELLLDELHGTVDERLGLEQIPGGHAGGRQADEQRSEFQQLGRRKERRAMVGPAAAKDEGLPIFPGLVRYDEVGPVLEEVVRVTADAS